MTDALNKHDFEIPTIQLHSDVKSITRKSLIFHAPVTLDSATNLNYDHDKKHPKHADHTAPTSNPTGTKTSPNKSPSSSPTHKSLCPQFSVTHERGTPRPKSLPLQETNTTLSDHKSHFYLQNPSSSELITFKVQTTQTPLYRVNKTDGILKPNEQCLIRVTRLKSEGIRHSDKHAMRLLWTIGNKSKLMKGEKKRDSKKCLSLVLPYRFFVNPGEKSRNSSGKSKSSVESPVVEKLEEIEGVENDMFKLQEKGIVLYPNLDQNKLGSPPKNAKFTKSDSSKVTTIQPVKHHRSISRHPNNDLKTFTLRSTKVLDSYELDLDEKRHEELKTVIENLNLKITQEEQRYEKLVHRTTDVDSAVIGDDKRRRFTIQFYLLFGMVAFFMGWMSGRFHFLASKTK